MLPLEPFSSSFLYQALYWLPRHHRAFGPACHAVLHAFTLGLRRLQGRGEGDENGEAVVHVDPAAVEFMLESAHKGMFGGWPKVEKEGDGGEAESSSDEEESVSEEEEEG